MVRTCGTVMSRVKMDMPPKRRRSRVSDGELAPAGVVGSGAIVISADERLWRRPGIHRQLVIVGATVEASGGKGVESLLGRDGVAGRECDGPVLHITTGIDAALAAEMDARQLHLDLVLCRHYSLLPLSVWRWTHC